MLLRLIIILLCGFSLPIYGATIVSKMSVVNSPNKTRIILQLSANTEHRIHYHPKTRQVLLMLTNSKTIVNLRRAINNTQIKNIHAKQQGKNLLIAFNVLEKFRIKSFMLKPSDKKNHRLIIDFNFNQKLGTTTLTATQLDIVIDPGHGGEDAGAIGILGVKEKTVTLAVAQKLYQLINQQPNMQAHLTRNADKYVGLNQRSGITVKIKADLFISIHADKYKDADVSGAAVYVYATKKGSSKMSGWLEKLEADSDFLSGKQTQYGSDDSVQKILMDLARKANKQHSSGLAKKVIQQFKSVIKLHSSQTQKANFYVLKHSTAPAILVELGFISNFEEERKLRSNDYQQQLANIIFTAIQQYIQSL